MNYEYIAFVASLLNLFYNIPQIILTVKTKKANNFNC